jgi:hypothetical protein
MLVKRLRFDCVRHVPVQVFGETEFPVLARQDMVHVSARRAKLDHCLADRPVRAAGVDQPAGDRIFSFSFGFL